MVTLQDTMQQSILYKSTEHRYRKAFVHYCTKHPYESVIKYTVTRSV